MSEILFYTSAMSMRNILQSTFGWLSRKKARAEEAEEAERNQNKDSTVEKIPTPKSAVNRSAPAQPSRPAPPYSTAPAPAKGPNYAARAETPSTNMSSPVNAQSAQINDGPEVKLVTRGAVLYGVCPHCEASWNIRERLMRLKYRKLEGTMNLTCPSCDKPVGLPPSVDLRKLS